MSPKLREYANLLLEWNKIHNLSGARNLAELEKIIDECIYPLEFIDSFDTCVDIGSGAGLPAIVLAILRPQSVFCLSEPRIKRASFLKNAVLELGLENVGVFADRIENLEGNFEKIWGKKISTRVDLVTSRAVTDSQTLIELSKKYLKSSGAMLFYKGSNLYSEIGESEETFRTRGDMIYFYKRSEF